MDHYNLVTAFRNSILGDAGASGLIDISISTKLT